jgi:hypothetical protein
VDVADFERRVNQILLTAFRLKARQGRRPRSDRQLRLPGSS